MPHWVFFQALQVNKGGWGLGGPARKNADATLRAKERAISFPWPPGFTQHEGALPPPCIVRKDPRQRVLEDLLQEMGLTLRHFNSCKTLSPGVCYLLSIRMAIIK